MPAQLRIALGPILWIGLVTLLIAAPWMVPGYIFATDFPGPRHFAFPSSAVSDAGLHLVLALAGLALNGELVGKAFIVLLLFFIGMVAYCAVPTGGFVARAASSLVYMVNPFVYDRLAYGQLTVLAGYAMLPWVANSTRQLVVEPIARRALVVALSFVVVGILDVHMALIALVVAASLVVTHVALHGRTARYAAALFRSLFVTALVAGAASSYWLVPLLRGSGPEARTLAHIGEADLAAFKTVSDPSLGLLPNVLGLYGFWAEQTGRFASMKVFATQWPLALGIVLLLCVIGAVAALRGAEPLHLQSSRAWALGLICAAVVAVLLEMGVSDPNTAPLVRWLDSVFPAYRGMRDASKWAAVLALLYSQLVALAVITLLASSTQRLKKGSRRELALAVVAALVLAVPFYYGNGLLYGMHGQIQPSSYPAGWYAADRALTADPHPGRAVFVPWHGYMAFSFVRNANRVVGSPAPLFFSVDVVASQNLEIPGVPAPVGDPDQTVITQLVASGGGADWATSLAERGFKYVLLARDADWRSYAFLNSQAGLVLVADFGSILLYRDLLWKQDSS